MNEIEKIRIDVEEYLNGNMTEEELINRLDLYKCPNCGTIILTEDKTYYSWDTGEIDDEICEQCREDAR